MALLTATAWAAPTRSANACSNSAVIWPVVTQPDSIASLTAAASAAPTSGRAKGMGSAVMPAVGSVESPTEPDSAAAMAILPRVSNNRGTVLRARAREETTPRAVGSAGGVPPDWDVVVAWSTLWA